MASFRTKICSRFVLRHIFVLSFISMPADLQRSKSQVVETNQQAQNKQKSYPKLQVPDIAKDNIRSDDIRFEQQTDRSLYKVRTWSFENQEVTKRSDKIRWFLKNGFIYLEYQANESGTNSVQLVFPEVSGYFFKVGS